MKKIISLLVAVIIAATSFSAQAQSKQQAKQIKKEAKKYARTLEKEGWKPAEAFSIESSLINYYTLVGAENIEKVTGHSSDHVNEKVAKNAARRDAAREYAESLNQYFEGVGKELEGKIDGEGIDNLVVASKNKFAAGISKELSISFVILKTNSKGTTDCRIFCSVSEEAAERARKQAIKNALEDADLAKKYGKIIDEVLDEAYE